MGYFDRLALKMAKKWHPFSPPKIQFCTEMFISNRNLKIYLSSMIKRELSGAIFFISYSTQCIFSNLICVLFCKDLKMYRTAAYKMCPKHKMF